jgi:Protein of unknown function (DUF1353)
MRQRMLATIAALPLCFATSLAVGSALAKAGGKFEGRLVAEWLDDGRNMRLIHQFGYLSPDRLRWNVPKGTIVNGASIPGFLWSFIGSPFGDKYRKASVIHDYYCENRTRGSSRVHRVFYEAMLDAGVSPGKAWLMYEAVKRFGPRWKLPKTSCKRVDGKIDFASCTRNSATSQPIVTRPKITKRDVQDFIEEMKHSKFPDAARELEDALRR